MGQRRRKAGGEKFQLLFNAGRSEEHARDPKLPWRWQSKSSLGQGWGGGLFKKVSPPLVESVPKAGELHPMEPGSVIVASFGRGSHLPHTDVAAGPEVLPPYDRDISGCHLSSFLYLSEEYQLQVQAGTALGGAVEVCWATIHL